MHVSAVVLFDDFCGGRYEHRTVVQGFIWGICSFDQWGTWIRKCHANLRFAMY